MFTLLLLAATAHSAPILHDRGLVLRAPTNGEFSGGVNAPTVEFDRSQHLFVMYFESPRETFPADCASSYEIGRATSHDGLTWMINAVPVLKGNDADSAALDHCGVSQPSVVYDGETWHLFYTQAGARASGSSSNTPGGIAYSISSDGVTYKVADPQVVPPSTDAARPVGLPSATILDGEILLMFDAYPDLHLYSALTDLSTGWTDEGMVLDHADEAFSETWLFGPALVCHPVQDLTLFVSGDGADGRAIAMATSPDAVEWTYDADTPISVGTVPFDQINHFDVLRNGSGRGWSMWYSMTDPDTGLKAIGHGTTVPWSARFLSKACY